MALKRRRAYKCFLCWKRFKTPQAVRGHRRHCRDPRLRLQAEAQPESQPVGTIRRSDKRPGPLSQDAKLLVLHTREGFWQLRHDILELGTGAYIGAGMNIPQERENLEVWNQILQDIEDCLREFDLMVPLFRLDRIALFRIHDSLYHLKERWIHQRTCSFHRPALEPDGLDEKSRIILRDEAAQLTSLLDQLKRLIVAAP